MHPNDLAEFLQNNDPPSEAVLKEVKDLSSKPLRELEHISKTLKDLEARRDAIQKSVTEYATILSPMRRISSDILHEIFYHCLPTHRNPIMSITEAPLLLTRICRPWRSIALSSHRIWSKLHIPLLPYSISEIDPYIYVWGQVEAELLRKQDELAKKYAKTMQTRSELARIWLSRSGSCGLSISLTFLSTYGQILTEDLHQGNPLLQLLNTVFSFSERFNDFEVTMPGEVYKILQDSISLDMMPNLRNFRANLFNTGREAPNPSMPKTPVVFLQSPNLQSLSLYIEDVGIAPVFPGIVPFRWANLTRLFFHSPGITSAEAVQVLRRCQNLDSCKLLILDGQDVDIGPEDPLPLPFLQFLSIQLIDFDKMTLIYRQINAPRLFSFEYQSHWRSSKFVTGDPPAPVLSLLEKSACMKKLSIDPRILSAQDMHFSLRFASKLTHLVVGQCSRYSDNGPHEARGPYQIGYADFNLDLLIIDTESTANPSSLIAEKEILLPKLERFEAYFAAHVTDETLLRFILSRLGDPAQKGVSSLKTVKVAFARTRQENIREKVDRRSKELGMEIVLDLLYFTKPMSDDASRYIDVSSPWYGLSSRDRSWHYPDDDEEGSKFSIFSDT